MACGRLTERNMTKRRKVVVDNDAPAMTQTKLMALSGGLTRNKLDEFVIVCLLLMELNYD